jgi:hypothetical protein
MKAAFLALAAAAVTATAAAAAGSVPYLPVPKDAAVILNTGSTNAQGYRIVITRTGSAEYVWGSRRTTVQIDRALAAKFFADAQRGMPLSELQAAPCMKSASFGATTFVWWRGQRSPDLSCPESDVALSIFRDALDVARALKIGTGSPVYVPTGEPRTPIPTSAP